MRIHTDLDIIEIRQAVAASGATIAFLETRGSRKRDHAFEIKLHGSSPYRSASNDGPAASWDEWGIFIQRVYEGDSEALVGVYEDWGTFTYATYDRFATLDPRSQHKRHTWNPRGDATAVCKCGAEQRWDWAIERRRERELARKEKLAQA